MEWKDGAIIQSGYFQKASSLQQKYAMKPIVKTFAFHESKEINIFGILPSSDDDRDADDIEQLLEQTFEKNKSINSILQDIFNLCSSVQKRNANANRQRPSRLSTPMNDKGVILAFQDNQLYIAYWNVITIIIVSSGQKATLLPSSDLFKNSCLSSESQSIQGTRIDLKPHDEYVLVASDRLLQYLTLEGSIRMINRLLRRNCSAQRIAESLVNATCSLGHRGELIVHLILLRKPEWNLDISIHGGSIYNTNRGFLPHCSTDYWSVGIKHSNEVCPEIQRNPIVSSGSIHAMANEDKNSNALEGSASQVRYRSASSIEEREKNLPSEDWKNSSALFHSKDDVEDTFLHLIKGNGHVVS